MRHNLRLFTVMLVAGIGLIAAPARSAAPFVVNSTRDVVDRNPGDGVCETQLGNGICTLRAAILEANALVGADTITLPAGLYVLSLRGIVDDVSATGDLDITSEVTLNGAGAADTIIDANHIDRVPHVLPGATATVSGVTIQHGEGSNEPSGGGVYATGSLTLNDSVVRMNTAPVGGGIALGGGIPPSLVLNRAIVRDNVATSFGGALNLYGYVVVNDSTLQGNTAGHSGGAIWTNMQLDLNNSVVRDNSALYWAGGILNVGETRINGTTITGNHSADGAGVFNEEQVHIQNSTISRNVAANNGGGIAIDVGTMRIANSIVGENNDSSGAAPNCLGTLSSRGYNLSDDLRGCDLIGDQTGNQTGSLRIGPLQDNGGATLTHALLDNSPALDAGNPSECVDRRGMALTTDQRGLLRPRDGDGNGSARCDIGAYEAQSIEIAPPVSCVAVGSADIGDGTSQVFTFDPHGSATHPLGSTQPGADIEGLAIHPVTDEIYASSGDSGSHHGALSRIDRHTGAVTIIGSTGFPNVNALAFRPSDTSLWGWAKGQGLISIDPVSGTGTLLVADPTRVAGLVWDAEGTHLYGHTHTLLWSYDPLSGAITTVATNVPHDIVSLAMRADGRLLGATQHNQVVRLFLYDLSQARALASDRIATPYSDVEYIAWPSTCAASSVPTIHPAHLDGVATIGAPGRYFPLNGTDFAPNTRVRISVQGRAAGAIESDGAVAAVIYFDPSAEPGEYVIDTDTDAAGLAAAAIGTQAVLTVDSTARRIDYAGGAPVLNGRPTVYLPLAVR